MGTYRKRFNEKGRAGMLAKQAALKKARQKQFNRHLDDGTAQDNTAAELFNNPDSNAETLAPVSEQERLERKRILEEQLYTENSRETKMSKSKKKRLDKYIDHQLKREEKKILLEKLSGTRVDTTILSASKELGKGRQTRREEMVEALNLERQGRADDHTRSVLYEERHVKEWLADNENEVLLTTSKYDSQESDSENSENETELGNTPSSFIDSRPAKFGGSGTGFAFANLQTTEKIKATKKYSWRKRLEEEKRQKDKMQDNNDFETTEEEAESDDEEMATESENGSETSQQSDTRATPNRKPSSSDKDNQNVLSNQSDTTTGSSESDDEGMDSQLDEDDASDGSSEDDSDTSDEPEEREPRFPKKHSEIGESFKRWAEQQVRVMEGRDHEATLPILSEKLRQELSNPTYHTEDFDRLSDEEGHVRIDKNLQRKATFVHVERDEQVQQQRMKLPVFAEEHRIMEAVNHHDCVVICGETGSGKTTQVPQFLYENGFGSVGNSMTPGMIGITQPRRVAAVSMAERVGREMGSHGHRVGHQIRFDTTIKNEGTETGTIMKFMTDGVLLREMMTDFLLKKYSAIIIDEAHERNINTDILIGMLSRILKLRRSYHEKDPKTYKPLKLVIMSATLRVSDFSENKVLFPMSPPIIKVDARQFPVSIHFNRRTHFEYAEEAFKKACKIHRRLPPGGILIFMTGQSEIMAMVKKLRAEFPMPLKKSKEIEAVETVVRLSKFADNEAEDVDFSVQVDKDGCVYDAYNANDEEEEEEGFDEPREAHQTDSDPLYVLPLYSLLPTKDQMKVFEAPPAGSRMCIVATNVAETSLTIPGIKYVVDAGRAKERKYNEENQVQSFEIDWISKASADQRAGRAGRTGPGHCYRLFSLAIFESEFAQFSRPEILRMPIESITLSMKSMGIDQVANFPFPTAPDRDALARSEKLLCVLGALDPESKSVTELGRIMALFPVSPRFAKILIIGNQFDCLPYIIAIVAAMSAGDPFIGEAELGIVRQNPQDDDDDEPVDEEANRKLRSLFHQSRAVFSRLDPTSDVLMLLSAVCAYDHIPRDSRQSFARENFMRYKTMEEIGKLRNQLEYIVKSNTLPDGHATLHADLKLGVPDKKQIAAIKQMIALGFLDQIAIRGDMVSQDVKILNKTSVINVPYAPVVLIQKAGTDPFIYIHPNSILSQCGTIAANLYVVYLSLSSNTAREGQVTKVRMQPMVVLSGKQLSNIAKSSPMITYSKPLGHPYAPKLITSTKRECYVVPRYGAAIGSGGVGWDLPVIKATQVKCGGAWKTE